MSKIIIRNFSSASDIDAVNMVAVVIAQGRISNDKKQYCYVTTFATHNGQEIDIVSELNKQSDRFDIYDAESIRHPSLLPDSTNT